MNDAEMKRWIRDEIHRQIIVLANGQAGENDNISETIEKLYPNSPSIPKRPVVHPAGFVSRAKRGLLSIIGKIGADPSNRLVLGHRDAKREQIKLQEGESALYSDELYQIKAMLDGIRVAKGDKEYALLLGEDIIEFLGKLVDLIALHTHGPPGTPPTNASDITKLKTDDLAGKTMLSTKDGGLT